MRLAIIGSEGLYVRNLERFWPEGVTEMVDGGTEGIAGQARDYALAHGIPLIPLPQEGGESQDGCREAMLGQADLVLAFWDGLAQDTQRVLEECTRRGIAVRMFLSLDDGAFLELEAKHASVFHILAQTARKKGKSVSKMSAGEMSPSELIRLIQAVIKARGKTKEGQES